MFSKKTLPQSEEASVNVPADKTSRKSAARFSELFSSTKNNQSSVSHGPVQQTTRPSDVQQHESSNSGINEANNPAPTQSARPQMSQRATTLQTLKHEVMCNYLYQQQITRLWLGHSDNEGVIIRRQKDDYFACPAPLVASDFGKACIQMNVPAAMTVKSRTVESLLAVSAGVQDIPLTEGMRMQVIATISDLPKARAAQCGAFIRDMNLLVVW